MKNLRSKFPKKNLWCLRPNTLRKVSDMRANIRNSVFSPVRLWSLIQFQMYKQNTSWIQEELEEALAKSKYKPIRKD